MSKTISLKYKTSTTFYPKPPYNFDPTVFKPSHYPDPLKVYESGKYWFVLRLKNKVYGIKLVNRGTIPKPKVQVIIFSIKKLSEKEIKDVIDEVSYRFEFQRDISKFSKKFKNDKILAPFIKKWYGMHGSCGQDLYGLLMIGIFLQNTVIKRSVKMTKVMLEKYGIKVKFDDRVLYYFWQPERIIKIPEKELRNLKVGYRAKLFIKTSKSFIKEKIDELKLRDLSVEEAKERLLKTYGVGPETARILLVEALHHYDIFDHVAPWQQKIYSRLLFNKKLVPTDKIIKYIKNKWGEWANLAASYIWEDIFWQRKQGKKIGWLEKEIRL
jgi:3-methyladenine DNA glycosylase/8-oxoguanine DNA glycosylase